MSILHQVYGGDVQEFVLQSEAVHQKPKVRFFLECNVNFFLNKKPSTSPSQAGEDMIMQIDFRPTISTTRILKPLEIRNTSINSHNTSQFDASPLLSHMQETIIKRWPPLIETHLALSLGDQEFANALSQQGDLYSQDLDNIIAFLLKHWFTTFFDVFPHLPLGVTDYLHLLQIKAHANGLARNGLWLQYLFSDFRDRQREAKLTLMSESHLRSMITAWSDTWRGLLAQTGGATSIWTESTGEWTRIIDTLCLG